MRAKYSAGAVAKDNFHVSREAQKHVTETHVMVEIRFERMIEVNEVSGFCGDPFAHDRQIVAIQQAVFLSIRVLLQLWQ